MKKADFIDAVKFLITAYMVMCGFWFSYIRIWLWIDLPIMWMLPVTLILAILSMFGLFTWIRNS